VLVFIWLLIAVTNLACYLQMILNVIECPTETEIAMVTGIFIFVLLDKNAIHNICTLLYYFVVISSTRD